MESNQETVEETVSQPNEEEGKGTNKTKKTSHRQKPKPWKTPGADITDYFNYGFTEETWEAYLKKQREVQAAMKKTVQSHSKHEEGWTRSSSSSSDSSMLFPRQPGSSGSSEGQHHRTRKNNRNRKLSSPKEDSATHLFTSPDFTCPPHFYFTVPPIAQALDSREERVRSRDQAERGHGSFERASEGQHGEREKRDPRKDALASCNNNSETKDTDKRGRRPKKARRKETAKETSSA